MSAKLAELGYEIETKLKPDGTGGRKYHTWDIKAAPGHEQGWQVGQRQEQPPHGGNRGRRKRKSSRRSRSATADAPDQLSASRATSSATTTRLAKRKDLTLDDSATIGMPHHAGGRPGDRRDHRSGRSRGVNPKPEPQAAQAMDYAIPHHFQRNSVVDYHDLAVTAMERSMGGALPEEFEPEAERQGVLFEGGEATTRAVWDQEQRIIGFARGGKGVFGPLAAGQGDDGLDGLSDEQKAAVRHVWDSTDQLMLIRGGAGTGKTTMMTPALARLGAPAVLLAPSSDASRGELRKEGFEDANTVAAFLGDEDDAGKVRGGGIIWVDEAGLLPINDLDRLCAAGEALDARIVLQGDPEQHKAVQRHGNMLDGAGGLRRPAGGRAEEDPAPERRLCRGGGGDPRRRAGKGRRACCESSAGWSRARAMTRWSRNTPSAIEETQSPTASKKTVLVIDPTHKDGDALTEKLRAVRKDKGLIAGEERTFPRLVPLGWTDAEKADASHYAGDEVDPVLPQLRAVQGGRPGEGQRAAAAPGAGQAGAFRGLSAKRTVNFAVGDTVRITANGWDVTGKHRIDNGRIDEIAGFTPERRHRAVQRLGDRQGFRPSQARAGVRPARPRKARPIDIVLAAMNRASLGAMRAEQGYVTVSRGGNAA